MRIHLGHHFYGAGNLGDDFMLAGFLSAMRRLAPDWSYTSAVPFPLEPLQRRFPEIEWLPYEPALRAQAIANADVWLGLGGSPFQSAQSRWFVDHLVADAAECHRHEVPMFYLGIGVQTEAELLVPEIRELCAQASRIYTRDLASAERLTGMKTSTRIVAGADLAHLFFRNTLPPAAQRGRAAIVANFDFGSWPGRDACLSAFSRVSPSQRVWLAQESRPLPGAEKLLHAALPQAERDRWTLVEPERAGEPLPTVLAQWPSAEWLVSSRYHAAIAGAWAGSKVVVIHTNEKLRSAAVELGAPLVDPDAPEAALLTAFDAAALLSHRPDALADKAQAACVDFVAAARA